MSSKQVKVLFIEWGAHDALGGTLQMEPLAELAYRRIIDMIYATDDNLIDDDKVMAYSTKTGNKWKAIKKSLINDHHKIYIENGYIRNNKCAEKLEKSWKNIAQKTKAGKASAEARKLLKLKQRGLTAEPTAAPTAEPTNQEPKDPIDVDTSAQADVSREAENIYRLGEQIAEIVGWDKDPRWFGNYSRLGVWLANGWDFNLDIFPTVKKLVKNKNGAAPSTLNYFEKAIADAYATRMAPIAQGTPVTEKQKGKGNGKKARLYAEAAKLMDSFGED